MEKQQIYPRIDKIAMNVFELVFTIKMQQIVKTVTLNQVIRKIYSTSKFSDDTTKLIKDMRKKNMPTNITCDTMVIVKGFVPPKRKKHDKIYQEQLRLHNKAKEILRKV